jgi:ABC-2 type transport system ATP-binding protein
MNMGKTLTVDTPVRVKALMEGEVVELVVDRVRDAYTLLKRLGTVQDVQAFGDRINVILRNAARDMPSIAAALTAEGISVNGRRIIKPSLENVFIHLLMRERPAAGRGAVS